jgi:hypothetical protein
MKFGRSGTNFLNNHLVCPYDCVAFDTLFMFLQHLFLRLIPHSIEQVIPTRVFPGHFLATMMVCQFSLPVMAALFQKSSTSFAPFSP